jgi:electron transport complex protein RnfC
MRLGGRYVEPAEALVSEGKEVEYEQQIGEPVERGFSVGVWASAGGTISSIEEDIVALEGAGHSLQEAEAEAEVR